MSGIEIDNFDVPDELPLEWEERGNGTINIIAERFDVDFSGTYKCDSDKGFDIWIELMQGDNYERLKEADLFNDYGFIDWSNACFDENSWDPDGESVNKSIITEEEIITQYDNGSFDEFTPGQAQLIISQGSETAGELQVDQEWTFDVEIPSEGLPIASNAKVTGLNVTTLPEGGGSGDVEVGITFENPANHEVAFTADYTIPSRSIVDIPYTYNIPGVNNAGGTNITTVMDTLSVNDPGFETIEVCYAGVCDTTDSPVGEPPEFLEDNVELNKCSAVITNGKTNPGAEQTLSLEAEVTNGNYQDALVVVGWYANGEEIARQDEVVDSKDSTKMFKEANYDLPVGDTEIEVEFGAAQT